MMIRAAKKHHNSTAVALTNTNNSRLVVFTVWVLCYTRSAESLNNRFEVYVAGSVCLKMKAAQETQKEEDDLSGARLPDS